MEFQFEALYKKGRQCKLHWLPENAIQKKQKLLLDIDDDAGTNGAGRPHG